MGMEMNSELLGPLTSGSGGDRGEGSAGGEGSGEGGATILERTRLLTPALRERGFVRVCLPWVIYSSPKQ